MKVIVTGATGFIGSALLAALRARGDEVVVLTRNAARARERLGPEVEVREWHLQAGPWMDAFSGADAVINLAGEPVADHRWTAEEKERILNSRVESTRAIVQAIETADPRPNVLINQSAIGYYGPRGNETLTEKSSAGHDFLASVVQEWEAGARPVEALGVRLVLLRTGIVLGRGGALARMALPFKLFAGGTMGDVGQWVSWIHIDDEIGLMLWALDNPQVQGVINATAPNPVTMEVFSRQIGEALRRPSWVPMLGVAMKLALGERAEAVISSQRVLPEVAERDGYRFRYMDSAQALRAVLS